MEILHYLFKNAFKPTVILLLCFLVWQVINHIPTEIKETRNEIKEVRNEIKEVRNEIKEVRNELNSKIDRIDNKLDKILFYLIDGDKEKLKEE